MSGRGSSRRVGVPAVVGSAVLLAATVGTVAATGGTDAVTGRPLAVERAAERPLIRALDAAKPVPLTRTPPPPATSAPAPPPAAPEPPAAQAPGTVRLAGGGTATLVRRDVVDGVLPVPDGVRDATWWGAAFDGPAGATVLAGHVNWQGATGPFASLWKSKVGDLVTVVDPEGHPFTFRVRELVTVHKDELPSRAQELFGQDGPHRLVLVTCGGRWVGGTDGYEENRIVIADPA